MGFRKRCERLISDHRCRVGCGVRWAQFIVHRVALRVPAVFCALLLVLATASTARAEKIDFSRYRHAADFCRGQPEGSQRLSAGKDILCAATFAMPNLVQARQLVPGGLFVVSGYGGQDAETMALADLLAERDATVVAYDHCLAQCASYLLIASSKAVVLKDTLVAWQALGGEGGDCLDFVPTLDNGPRRWDVIKCPVPLSRLGEIGEVGEVYKAKQRFFEKRRLDPLLEEPPESAFVRESILKLFERLEFRTLVMWTWHPRYQEGAIKTHIIYEAYPKSQREVDAMAKRLHLHFWVLYDR
jgi:hypothetical protein